MKRNMNYRVKSLKELIDGYARIKDTFNMLDNEPDAAERIYRERPRKINFKRFIFTFNNYCLTQ